MSGSRESSLPVATILWRASLGIVLTALLAGLCLHPYLNHAVWFGEFQLAALGSLIALGVGKSVIHMTETPSLLLDETQILDLPLLARRLLARSDQPSQFVFNSLAVETVRELESLGVRAEGTARLRQLLVRDLNNLLLSKELGCEEPFAAEAIREEIGLVKLRLVEPIPQIALNRSLLERAFPNEIESGWQPAAGSLEAKESVLYSYANHVIILGKSEVRQRRIALVFSVILGGIVIFATSRHGFDQSGSWLLLPIILIGPFLYLRKALIFWGKPSLAQSARTR